MGAFLCPIVGEEKGKCKRLAGFKVLCHLVGRPILAAAGFLAGLDAMESASVGGVSLEKGNEQEASGNLGIMTVFMTPQVQMWMPAILALFGSLLVVVFTAWWNTKILTAQIEALRTETRQGFAELRLDFHTEISPLTRCVERP
jgi:hypothetical protein